MKYRLLSYKSSQISYYSYGSGPEPVICFHGYGEDATMYSFLEKYGDGQNTFIAIDLPFHGQTVWNEGLTFTYIDLQEIITTILLENGFSQSIAGNDSSDSSEESAGQLTLMGFSLGGRMALSFYQAQPNMIKKLILLAPDGLKVNFWYWLSTRTWVGNKLFAFTMKHPRWFFGFLKVINRLGMVNSSVFKFVNFYIGNKDARLQLYQRWTSLRHLKPNLECIKSLIREYKTPLRLIYGQHDRIILPVRGEQFQKGIEEYSVLKVIASGHQVLHEKHVGEILTALQQ
jgi:pimeloyl-ACP methyl ester carboxylesterase